jgi:hypothetical protein
MAWKLGRVIPAQNLFSKSFLMYAPSREDRVSTHCPPSNDIKKDLEKDLEKDPASDRRMLLLCHASAARGREPGTLEHVLKKLARLFR